MIDYPPSSANEASGSPVLVTGGAGYIGSHTCKTLSLAGYVPVTYDNLSGGHKELVRWGPFEQGDILDRDRLNEVLNRYRPEACLHFAGLIQVGESVAEPEKYYRNNVTGTITLLEALLDHDIKKFVFSSSAAVYGDPHTNPIQEDHPLNPINPYGSNKMEVEAALKIFSAKYGMRSVSLRYFNAAGADPEGETGESHEPETHLIPLVLDAAAGKRPCITIFGDDYNTLDGTCLRDYIHVTDLARAHVLALQKIEQEEITAAYNLGYGKGFSVKEVIRTVEGVTGLRVPVVVGDRRQGDPPELVADPSWIKRELAWESEFDNLETIVATAWKWHRNNPIRP